MSVNEKMTAIADAIREKTGGTAALSLDEMAAAIAGLAGGGGFDWGSIEISGGIVTHTSSTTYAQIKHGLSGTPNGYLIFRTENTNTDAGLQYALGYNYKRYNTSTGGSLSNGVTVKGQGLRTTYINEFTADETTFSTYTSSDNFTVPANIHYYWMAWR